MLKTNAADILRYERKRLMSYIVGDKLAIAHHEKELTELRKRVEDNEHLHCQLGASIQVLQGDNAPLDLPPDPQPEQSH